MRISIALLPLFIFFSHCTYDRTLIYRKDYTAGFNKLLRHDGFYFSTQKVGAEEFIYPVFFYEDGSVILMGAVKDTAQLRKVINQNPTGVWGYWGNYQVNKDTISIETIASGGESFHHERRIKMGWIKDDSIYFFKDIDRKGKIEQDSEFVSFVPFKAKPDSSANWIRKKKKFNR